MHERAAISEGLKSCSTVTREKIRSSSSARDLLASDDSTWVRVLPFRFMGVNFSSGVSPPAPGSGQPLTPLNRGQKHLNPANIGRIAGGFVHCFIHSVPGYSQRDKCFVSKMVRNALKSFFTGKSDGRGISQLFRNTPKFCHECTKEWIKKFGFSFLTSLLVKHHTSADFLLMSCAR